MRTIAVRSEHGFTMAVTMLAMLAVMGLTVAAFGAVGGDLGLGARSVDEKKAYAGAEAGLAYYLQKLAADNDYWTSCDVDPSIVAPAVNPVNQPWEPATGADPRRWKALPTDARVQYTIELLPRAAQCSPTDNSSMIDPNQGTLRIRTTGRSGPPGRVVKRSIVTTLRRNGFLDFIYFTDLETSDPAQQQITNPNNYWVDNSVPIKRTTDAAVAANPATPIDTIHQWADQDTACKRYYDAARNADGVGRDTVRYGGMGYFDADGGGSEPTQWNLTSRAGGYNIRCSTIQFSGSDVVAGPFHSNDTIRPCDSPTFGRAGKNDRIEFWAMIPSGGCSASPNYTTTPKTGLAMTPLTLPPSNTELKETTFQPYLFTGATTIVLNDQTMTVTSGGVTVNKSLPANGLVYVQSDPSGSCPAFDILRPYTSQPACGDVFVQGTYGKSITIASDRDVVVTGDLVAKVGSDTLAGLIANNYVRVKHGVASYPCTGSTADSPAGPQPRTIEAAILSIGHVFTVDNYQCGDDLGLLTVKGAIAQKYRGPVGTSGSPRTGYIKNYQYDDRLRFRSPPFFIAPIESAWRPIRSTEQAPAR